MGFHPTPEQQLALDARGSVLVSAAAGSGKTAVLSHRVVERLMDPRDPIDVGDMLIVTFTNAAAAEMRERICAVLTEYIQEHPDNFRVVEQKTKLDSASIGTIDSFCMDLIRDNFDAVGINPDFRIASKEQLAVMEKNGMAETLRAFLTRDREAFGALAAALGIGTNLAPLGEKVLKIYRYIQSLPFPDDWLDMACENYRNLTSLADTVWAEPLFRRAFDQADYHKNAVGAALQAIGADESLYKGYQPSLSHLYDTLCEICEAVRSRDYNQVSRLASDFAPISLRPDRKADPVLREYAKGVFDAAKGAMQKLKEAFDATEDLCLKDMDTAGRCVNTLCQLVREFSQRLAEEKKRRNLYGFSDIEHAALNLLCEGKNGEIRVKDGELRTRFREVLVDEYQDTNDLQNAMFYALSDCGKNLFLVGDVKQSIYRFRRANPSNFIRKKEAYPEFDGSIYPAKISLNGNFRSRTDVCDFVNFVFRLLMSKPTAEMDYRPEDELRPMGTFAPDSKEAVELHLLPTGDTEREADYVAQYIANAVHSGETVSDGNGHLRPVAWSDFTVLLRSCKKNAEIFLSAFKKIGVPAWAESKEGFFDREEIRMALSLLRCIDNPLQDIPLMATMMSPMFGFEAEEMAQIRLCDRKGSLYSAVKRYVQGNKKAENFLSSLSRYRDWSDTVPSDRLIRMVLDDTGLTAIVQGMDDGASRRANLLVLAECAADYETTGFHGLTPFLRYLDGIQKNGGEIPAAVVCESENVVRIRSIHKSKGLQSPICVLACMTGEFNQKDSRDSLVLHESLGIGMRICDDAMGKKYDTVPRKVMSFEETDAVLAEEMRLLYVAMTRVQDRLVMLCADANIDRSLRLAAQRIGSGWEGRSDAVDPVAVRSAKSYAEWLYMACLLHPSGEPLRERTGVSWNCAKADGSLKVVFAAEAALCDAAEEPNAVEQRPMDFAERFDYLYPYEQLMPFEAKYSVSQLAKSMFDPNYCCTARPAFVTGDKLTAAEKGTATHKFMCFADYRSAESSVEEEIRRLIAAGRLTEEQGRGIDRETVRSFFESGIYHRIVSADRVLRESRFIYEVAVRELDPSCDSDETVVVQGVADCVIFEPDGLTILDFKTDRNCTQEDLIQKYTRQLAIYSDAFSSNYGLPAKASYLYSFSLKKEIRMP